MSITHDTIAAIQHAGQALDAARAALSTASQNQSARVAAALAGNAFGVENDALFEHWKAIARMVQAVQAMEEQMKTIFQTAGEIAFDVPAPGVAPRARQPLRLASRAPHEPASDVQIRATGTDAPARKGGKAGARKAAGSASTAPLKGNAARVMVYLSGCLNRRGFARVTHGEIAAGAPIPTGSVGAALAALKAKGLVLEGERGSYKLG